jgi:hypothetical protein
MLNDIKRVIIKAGFAIYDNWGGIGLTVSGGDGGEL